MSTAVITPGYHSLLRCQPGSRVPNCASQRAPATAAQAPAAAAGGRGASGGWTAAGRAAARTESAVRRRFAARRCCPAPRPPERLRGRCAHRTTQPTSVRGAFGAAGGWRVLIGHLWYVSRLRRARGAHWSSIAGLVLFVCPSRPRVARFLTPFSQRRSRLRQPPAGPSAPKSQKARTCTSCPDRAGVCACVYLNVPLD